MPADIESAEALAFADELLRMYQRGSTPAMAVRIQSRDAAIRAETIRECAAVCDKRKPESGDVHSREMEAEYCAEAIRSLAEEPSK